MVPALFRGRVTRLELDLALAPRTVGERLAKGMDPVRSLLLTPTWGLNGRFVGNLREQRVQMRVRHRYSNGYTRLLFGRIEPSSHGSKLRVEFRDVRFVVALMNLAWYAIMIPSLIYLARVLSRAQSEDAVDWTVVGAGLLGPGVTLSVFAIVEIIGRRLGQRDELQMRRHIEQLFGDATT